MDSIRIFGLVKLQHMLDLTAGRSHTLASLTTDHHLLQLPRDV